MWYNTGHCMFPSVTVILYYSDYDVLHSGVFSGRGHWAMALFSSQQNAKTDLRYLCLMYIMEFAETRPTCTK